MSGQTKLPDYCITQDATGLGSAWEGIDLVYLEDVDFVQVCADLRQYDTGDQLATSLQALRQMTGPPEEQISMRQGSWLLNLPDLGDQVPGEILVAFALARTMLYQAEIGAMWSFGLRALGYIEHNTPEGQNGIRELLD